MICAGAIAFGSAGCVLNPALVSDRSAMVGELPSRWTGGGHVPSAAVTGWLDDFGSSRMKAFVKEAVGNNYDLSAALSRVEQAKERARISGADQFPTVDGSIQTSRSQNLRGAAFQTVTANNFNFSMDLAWEVDLWGRIRNLKQAELDRLTAEAAAYEASRLSLAATVAKTTLQIVESKLQIALSRRTLSSLRTNLQILDSKLEAGDADDRTALEISLSRADVARAESNLLAEQRQLDASKRTLETLLGKYPSGEIDSMSVLPQIRRSVPAGLPSELLLRRPDLLAAEARVDAAYKDLAASRKALLPAIRITGGIGTSTTDEFGDLFDIQNMVWNIGAGLTQPVFRAGRLKAEIQLDEKERDELASTYAETALTAFREVETALAAEKYLKGQVSALSRATSESRRAEELSLRDYETGIVDIITLLESQRRAFDSESQLLSRQLELLTNRIDLYLALGGDFDHPPIEK